MELIRGKVLLLENIKDKRDKKEDKEEKNV